MDIGFIGLGTMGAPMARNLLRKGHRLAVLDASPQAVDALVSAGARAAATAREVAEHSAVVITMLPDAPDVEAVALGPDGIVAGLRRDAVYIDMSTIDPLTTRRIGAHVTAAGARMIDSPVGKTADAAVAGTLTLMVGGPADVVEQCRPILSCMGTDLFHCGDLGAGQTMKLLNNLLAQAVGAASAEALVTGVRAGLSVETMLSVLRTTMAWNNQLAISMPKKSLAGDFKPGFKLKLAHKDCRLAVDMARSMGLNPLLGQATVANLEDGLRAGLQDMDVGAMLKLREEQAGVTVRLQPS